MMERLTKGQVIKMTSGKECRVLKELGEGGQGYIYKVRYEGKDMALKWYKMDKIADKGKFYRNLQNNIKKGAPTKAFVWPVELTVPIDGGFGYLMDLISDGYAEFKHYLLADVHFSGIKALINAALGLIDGFEKLHNAGFSYQDLNDGNFSIHPETGDVLICDNDNVSANGIDNSSVYGTPRFMAPEIVMGQAKPSRNTDLYSLAVLLFYMFMMGHPLEGKLEAEIKCMDIHAMNKLYGKNPIFIYDPNDKSNRPVKGYQDNVIIYWELYPQVIRDLFIKSFTVGLTAPNKRVTEKEWLEAFANLLSGIVLCPKCGAEVFFDAQKHDNGIAQTCWNCKSIVPMPATLTVGKSRVLLQKDAKLYAHHIYGNFDMNTVVGSVVQNPKNPNLWGIRNESTENWTYIKPDGMQIPVAIGKSAAIAKDVRIDFGQMTGEFK